MKVLKILKESDRPTIRECNGVLEKMQTLEMTNPLYIVATCIFCETKAYREQWMKLSEKPEELRKSWIAMNAKKLGYL